MAKGGTVTFDADEYLELLDELTDLEKRLRNLGKDGYNFKGSTTKPPSPARREKAESEAMEIQLDISGIDWQTKDKQPAGPNTPWCWAHAHMQDGGIRRETVQLVAAVEQYGTVRVGKYEITLGGRDGTLLNRRVKK